MMSSRRSSGFHHRQGPPPVDHLDQESEVDLDRTMQSQHMEYPDRRKRSHSHHGRHQHSRRMSSHRRMVDEESLASSDSELSRMRTVSQMPSEQPQNSHFIDDFEQILPNNHRGRNEISFMDEDAGARRSMVLDQNHRSVSPNRYNASLLNHVQSEAPIWDISSRVSHSHTNRDNLYFPGVANLPAWSEENVFAPGYPRVGTTPLFDSDEMREHAEKLESSGRLRSTQRPIRINRNIYSLDGDSPQNITREDDEVIVDGEGGSSSSHIYEDLDGINNEILQA